MPQRGGAAPAPVGRQIAAPGRPNIVFVLTDDLAWNLIQYMPHVLAMQRRGVTFSNYFVTDSLCCPSRSSIFSGRFPHDTHVFTNSAPDGGFMVFHDRNEESSTFATALATGGYQTALMGKYLNGYQPGGSQVAPGPYVPPGWSEWDVAGNAYSEFGYRLNENGQVVSYGYRPRAYLTDVLARRGTAFIRSAALARTPFMVELATFAPHTPYTPAPRDSQAFPGLTAPKDDSFNAANLNAPRWLSAVPPLNAQQISDIDGAFRQRVQAVQAVDRMIGQIQGTLAATGQAKNTYIVFSSDNGLHMGEHRLTPGKLTAFDSDIRVPLIVVGPHVPHGRAVRALTQNTDLRSTFSSLAGTGVPSFVDGHSLVALLHGRRVRHWRNAVLIEHHGPDANPSDPDNPATASGNPTSYEAVRTPHAIYVRYADGQTEYYNLARDPFELDNAVSTLSPARQARFESTLSALVTCHGAASCWAAGHASP